MIDFDFAAVIAWLKAYPVLLLVLLALPFFLLALLRRVYPYTPMALLAMGPCILTLALLVTTEVLWLVVLVDLAVAGLSLIDLLSIPRDAVFNAERQVGRVLSLNVWHNITLSVTNRSSRHQVIWIRDDLSHGLEAEPAEFFLIMPGSSRLSRQYRLKATKRGAFYLSVVYLRIRSRFGLWQRFLRIPVHSEIHVYPDMQQLSEYAVLARANRLSLMGLRSTRMIGQDNEFERLRDYTLDDNYKHIDWRSTARRNKLTVKDFQANQSQRLILLVDCGRMMTNSTSGLSLLDHALNAMLMLSYVALRQGDSVGLVCFSDQIHSFVPPSGGMNQMNRLLHASFDRFPRLVESRYDQAFLHLASHCRKRSLVILISNVVDEVNAHQLHQYLGALAGRHLPLGVLLRDRQLFNAADSSDCVEDEIYRAAAAAEVVTWRHQVLADLERQGVLSLDVFPEELTAPLVNRYLDIKARHLL